MGEISRVANSAAIGLAGRVALVTGGSGGIGAELCRSLGRQGALVAIHFHAGRAAAEAIAADIVGGGGRALAFAADLSDPGQVEALIGRVEEDLGPVEVLVANAGTGRPKSYEEVDATLFDEAIALNLRAPYLLARRTLGHMRANNFGRIMFVSSVAAFTGGLVGPHYAASKAGLHGLTHFLAARCAAEGVTVNAIAPALIQDTAMLPGDPAELAGAIPVGRLGTPEEVASLVMAILGNGYMTSKVVALDGGLYPR